MALSVKTAYAENGYHLIEHAVGARQIEELIAQLSVFAEEANRYGVRDLMSKVPAIHELATSAPLLTVARDILGEAARPVRSVFFDKVPGANWNVAWHQDTSLALKAMHEVSGFGPWSEKQGVPHAEPPPEYLANTLTLRLHLDRADTQSGVLRVVPGTHRLGRVRSAELLAIVEQAQIVECNAQPGDLLLMNPLLFHSSRKATQPVHRRIVHIEYSAMALPAPLEWYELA